MMSTSKRRYAVLVGVNYYREAAKLLRGAVSDVKDMHEYLQSQGIEKIWTFVTREPSDAHSNLPQGDSSEWATFDNVVNCMQTIARTAEAGDHLLFQFCGHGTQTPPTLSKYSHAQTGDLALVLFDAEKDIRYLRSSELAGLLKTFTDNKVSVTVILDCCYAASIIRHGDSEIPRTRGIKYDSHIDAAYPLDRSLLARSNRDARNTHERLLDPEMYTIIAACGLHEKADEMKHHGGGALSYFLLRALRVCAGDVTVQAVYDHLRLKFHMHWPIQTPACYGRKDVSFFGDFQQKSIQRHVSVLKKKDVFVMDVGYAHGVCKGDEYALFPLSSPEESSQRWLSKTAQASFPRARADEVNGTTSTLELVETLNPELRNESRWLAKMLSLPSWQCPVRFPSASPAEFEQWTSAMTKKRFIIPLVEGNLDSCQGMQVMKADDGKCRILDASGDHVRNLPPLPYSLDDRSVGKLTNVLQHLATYKYIQAIENETPIDSFEESFTTYLEDGSQKQYKSGQTLEISEGDDFNLTVINQGKGALYLAVFDMGPQWQIDNIFAEEGEDFKVLAPYRVPDIQHEHTGRLDILLNTEVPDDLVKMGHHHCEDVIKVFVTSKATSFASLAADKLPISVADYTGPTRGKRNCGALAQFLASLTLPVRGPGSNLPNENWTTRTFIVHTIAND